MRSGLLHISLLCFLVALATSARAQEPTDVMMMTPAMEALAGELNRIEPSAPGMEEQETPARNPVPAWLANSTDYHIISKSAPKIAIIIDDMGMDIKHTEEAAGLEGVITLAYLPYAPSVGEQARLGRALGHEIIAHVPMEPEGNYDTGANVLLTGLDRQELEDRLDANLAVFGEDILVGINNHMGSKFTKHTAGLGIVMQRLQDKGLLFIDSRSDGKTIAEQKAIEYGVPTTSRDVFLDHDDGSVERVLAALDKTESIARKQGHAVAIGHPKRHTLDALKQWLPQARERGLEIVPLTTIVKLRDPKARALANSLGADKTQDLVKSSAVYDEVFGPFLARSQAQDNSATDAKPVMVDASGIASTNTEMQKYRY